MRLKKEEYTSLGDFIKISFVRDQSIIMKRFPKLNEDFLTDFTEKLEAVKTLESRKILTQRQKEITESLYSEADTLDKELSFLSSYITSCGLNTLIVTNLKKDLKRRNIEAATIKIEDLKQYIDAHTTELVAEGMSENFIETLNAHKSSLSDKNAQQNSILNNGKSLTKTNEAEYETLYNYILKITDAGKLMFSGTITEDEYSISKTLNRMKAPKRNKETPTDNQS